jgi:Spy/CpxP family protein refolding chaperone
MRTITAALVALVLLPAVAAAQQTHDHAGRSEHAGLEVREIKALDPAVIADYLNGAGMGFALSAELNGFPGPRHVLELADSLALTPQQRAETSRIFEAMQVQAREVGALIVEAERELDRRFAHRHVDAETISQLTSRIAALNGRARAIHLSAHVETTGILTEAQVLHYNRLRGYAQ